MAIKIDGDFDAGMSELIFSPPQTQACGRVTEIQITIRDDAVLSFCKEIVLNFL